MQVSYVLIPFALYLYYHIPYRKYILYHIICIGVIGSYDTYLQYKHKQINNQLDQTLKRILGMNTFFALSFCIHLLCLVALKDFYRYKNTNIPSFLLLGLANIIIRYLPYWPYYLSKTQVATYYNCIYLLLLMTHSIIR